MIMKYIACLFLLIILLSGCRRHLAVEDKSFMTVDSISSKDIVPKKTYYLFPGNEDTTSDNLLFKEFAEYVHYALSTQGYKNINDMEKAGTAIYLAYGMGAPKTNVYTQTSPTFGVTGVSSSSSFGTIRSNGNFSATTNYTPTYGITGYTTSVGTYDTFFKYLVVDAYDVERTSSGNNLRQLFKTTVACSNTNDDLRSFLPIMALASAPYIGTNTGRKVDINYSESERTKYIRKKYLSFSGGTVTDTRSGLMWTTSGNLPKKSMSWDEAVKYVSALDYGGYRDWRLPSMDEFDSLARFNVTDSSAEMKEYEFIDVQGISYYWASKPDVKPKYAGTYWFPNYYGEDKVSNKYSVWPVRTVGPTSKSLPSK